MREKGLSLSMAEEAYKAKLIGGPGEQSDAVFVLDRDDSQRTCTLILRFLDNELAATEFDYFEALCRIREQLESFGLRPHCYGTSRNVFPSGMGRDMALGLQAYKTRIGAGPKFEDSVFISESGPDVEPVSVREQKAFHDQWINSLR